MTNMHGLSGTAPGAEVLEKLEARQEARRAEREQRQQELERVADPREDIHNFLGVFSADFSALQQRCSTLEHKIAAADLPEDQKQVVLQQSEELSSDANLLEQKVSDAAYFLPAYELRSCSNQMQQLRAQLSAIKQQLQPKRKFTFSKAVKKTATSASTTQQSSDTIPADQTAGSTVTPQSYTAAITQQEEQQSPKSPNVHDLQLINAGHGCMGTRNQTLLRTAEQLAGQAFVLHDLEDCTVFLLGHLSALRLQQLRNCKVFTGPVSGATFIDGASNCTLMIASHQVRIHNATNCDFYLRVRSRPIIEHSSNLRFAPYPVDTLITQQQEQQQQPETAAAAGTPATNLQQLFQEAQLAGENDLWQQVDDFGWVKATQSPNWSVLPEQQRQQPLCPACQGSQ